MKFAVHVSACCTCEVDADSIEEARQLVEAFVEQDDVPFGGGPVEIMNPWPIDLPTFGYAVELFRTPGDA